MRRLIVLILLSGSLFLNSCGDNGCKPVSPQNEESIITAYASANGITATKHSTGLFYQIISQGNGPTPNLGSKVTVTYVGKRLDNTVFDQATSPVTYNLSALIAGWQIGLPLIQKGGQIRLIVPSSMAYSCVGVDGTIQPNTVLYFDIQLIDVQ